MSKEVDEKNYYICHKCGIDNRGKHIQNNDNQLEKEEGVLFGYYIKCRCEEILNYLSQGRFIIRCLSESIQLIEGAYRAR